MIVLIEGLSLLPPRTGIGRSTFQLISSLAKNTNIDEIHLVLPLIPYSYQRIRWINSLRKINTKIRTHTIPLPYGLLLFGWDHYQFPPLDRLWTNMDIVHAPNYILPPLHRAAGVLTIHDLSLVHHPEWYASSAHPLMDRIRRGIHAADRIVAPSQTVCAEIADFYKIEQQKVSCIPHPLTGNYVSFNQEEKESTRLRLFGRNFPYLFWCGEINPRKNLLLILDTLLALRCRGFHQLKLILVGTCGFRGNEIQDYAGKNHLSWLSVNNKSEKLDADIIQYGFVTDEQLYQLYSAAELMIFPSWDEGFGFPILEAMASGIPVIASKKGSLPELIQDAGILLDPVEDKDEFVDHAENLLKNEAMYNLYKQKGLQRASYFQKLEMDELLVNVYTEAIREKKGRS